MEKYYLYIVLTRTNTVISRLIRVFKKDRFTHASLSLDKDLNQMYSFGRKHFYNPFVGRFRKENINEGIYKFCHELPGAIIEIEVTKEQYENVEELLFHFIKNKDLYKYNYMGLIHNIINKDQCSENRFLCSEFVYYILKESGVIDLHMPRNLVRPQSLLDIDGKVVYKDNLKENYKVRIVV